MGNEQQRLQSAKGDFGTSWDDRLVGGSREPRLLLELPLPLPLALPLPELMGGKAAAMYVSARARPGMVSLVALSFSTNIAMSKLVVSMTVVEFSEDSGTATKPTVTPAGNTKAANRGKNEEPT